MKSLYPEQLNIFGQTESTQPKTGGVLNEKFLVPPFSVLDTRAGYWQNRKRAWINLGIQTDLGREELSSTSAGKAPPEYMANRGNNSGGSNFDPVLCELAYKWFCPSKGYILDPFAGGSTRGIVANYLGYNYTGIDVREEQIEANYEQAGKIQLNSKPKWVLGDSSDINSMFPLVERYDLIFTCPPYYDLEIYSEKEKDGSNFETYEKFMIWYCDIFSNCVKRLKNNRFVVVVVGEIRNKKTGEYRNFVGDTISCFKDKLGLYYYNEIILMTAIGSLPVRVGKQFSAGRKIGKTHQNVLVFYKGDMKKIKEELGEEVESLV